ncbi:MAG TPA: hypothetical protein VHE30_28735 [Polyangiaceae bacterium]|nr:hypothetical protein [Polyangiaceae bacterium]
MERRTARALVLLASAVLASGAGGCGGAVSHDVAAQAKSVGRSCTPAEEQSATFGGFGLEEVTIEENAPECDLGVCLVAAFQGRTTCAYGQPAGADGTTVDSSVPDDERCRTPSGERVTVPVSPQKVVRPPSKAVYCSCRCGGPDPEASYCACPSGFECRPLVEGSDPNDPVTGSYCVLATNPVSASDPNCARPAADRDVGGCGIP